MIRLSLWAAAAFAALALSTRFAGTGWALPYVLTVAVVFITVADRTRHPVKPRRERAARSDRIDYMRRQRARTAAVTTCARINELLTQLAAEVSDVTDAELWLAVAAARQPVLDAGNRLAQLRELERKEHIA